MDNKGEIIIYETADRQTQIDAKFETELSGFDNSKSRNYLDRLSKVLVYI